MDFAVLAVPDAVNDSTKSVDIDVHFLNGPDSEAIIQGGRASVNVVWRTILATRKTEHLCKKWNEQKYCFDFRNRTVWLVV